MNTLLEKLEEIKQMGSYAITLGYGEGVGCDDLRVKTKNRSIWIAFRPVGCLGEARVIYQGKIKHCLSFDFKTNPKIVSNPPNSGETDKDGYYLYGTDEGLQASLNRFGWKKQ